MFRPSHTPARRQEPAIPHATPPHPITNSPPSACIFPTLRRIPPLHTDPQFPSPSPRPSTDRGVLVPAAHPAQIPSTQVLSLPHRTPPQSCPELGVVSCQQPT